MQFLTGTQYYRYPTPTPGHWDRDLGHIKSLGFDFIQIRPQWRWHERREGKYEWDDVDALFELAEKHKLKILFKFLLETGPEWLFDDYQAHRVGPDNHILTPYANGSFYIGGMIPCFDHPVVLRKAEAFIENAVKRYASHQALFLWNAWNEPRNRPYGECACSHSRGLFSNWLRSKYHTVEDFNQAFGMAESSFESIKPPVCRDQQTFVALWKQWARQRVAERVRFVRDCIRRHDPRKLPVMTHVGMCSVTQDILNDGSDDSLNSSQVDQYGTSYIHWAGEYHSFNRLEREIRLDADDWAQDQFLFSMMTDWMRAVKEPFWVSEFYSNSWGMETPNFSAEDIRFRIFEAVGNGAKGINLWQFRPEVYCNESGITGLINPDNSDSPRSLEWKAFNAFKDENAALLADYRKDRGDIAIVYDPESDLISRLEETDSSNQDNFVSYRYKQSIKGWYSMFWRSGMNVDFIPMSELRRIRDYPGVVLPYCTRYPEHEVQTLSDYVRNGGVVFSDPGLAQRDSRNWMNETVPAYGLDEVFGLQHSYLKHGTLEQKMVVNHYGNGKTIYYGWFPGVDFFRSKRLDCRPFITDVKKHLSFKECFSASGLLVVKQGASQGKRVSFLLNYEKHEVSVTLLADNKHMTLPPRTATLVVS